MLGDGEVLGFAEETNDEDGNGAKDDVAWNDEVKGVEEVMGTVKRC